MTPSLKLFMLGIGSFVVLPAWSGASDWPSPQDAWMRPPDNVIWPKSRTPVKFRQQPVGTIDRRLGGNFAGNLEAGRTPESVPALWLDLNGDDIEELIYVDEALSGTGGKNVRVVTWRQGQWAWIADALCESLEVVDDRRLGWKSLSCMSQRGLEYKRGLIEFCGSEYRELRAEVHDLEDRSVVVQTRSCSQE